MLEPSGRVMPLVICILAIGFSNATAQMMDAAE
jgi:hypothetical protein